MLAPPVSVTVLPFPFAYPPIFLYVCFCLAGSVATHASTAVTFPVAVIEPPLSAYPIMEPNPLASVSFSAVIIHLLLAT